MLAALFRYIRIPDSWVRVLLQILRGPVLFLVMGDAVREEVLPPASGIRQRDPLSPILFSLLTSLICFVLQPYRAAIWLYSDDALIRIVRPEESLVGDLRHLLDEFASFGEYTGLPLNLDKTKVLVQGLSVLNQTFAGLTVASYVKYLGALFGMVTASKAYEHCVGVFESRCVQISRMPLSRQQKVQLLHTWCYPVLQLIAVANYPPDRVLTRLRRALITAFQAQNWKIPLNELHLPPS